MWKSITATLSSHNLPQSQWESVLSDALHAQRSLLCTATNQTPHERMFNFPRKSSAGSSMPSWLKPGPVLVKRHVRNKYDPLVDDAELLEVTPLYGTVRLHDGRELNVSLRDLAPAPSSVTDSSFTNDIPAAHENADVNDDSELNTNDDMLSSQNAANQINDTVTNPALPSAMEFHDPSLVRRSSRVSKPVQRYGTSDPSS